MINGVTRLLQLDARIARALPAGLPQGRAIRQFLESRPQIAPRFLVTVQQYMKLFDGKPFPVNNAILHKLANPDQTPRQNASCAYYFANPQKLVAEYAEGGYVDDEFEDMSMVAEHPQILRSFTRLIPPGSTVLSLGMGEAPIEAKLAKKGAQVTGIEFVPELAERARKLGIEVICGDIHRELTGMQRQFDFIVMSEVLGDLDARRIFSQLPSVMHPQTKLLLSTYLPSPKVDGTGYERMWTRTLEKILGPNGLAITKKRVWRVIEHPYRDEENLVAVKDGYEFDDAFVMYVIEKRRAG